MIDKETYKSELIRMLDSHRTKHKGEHTCVGVKCEECQLYGVGCGNALYIYETIEAIEKWSKEHPKPKYEISQLEYDILKSQGTNVRFGFYADIRYLLSKGYFKGATSDMCINDYLENCEVVEDE